MPTLEEYRYKPGTKLRTEYGTRSMVIDMCAGMIRDGARPSGGDETVAIVSLETGRTNFEHGSLEVVPPRE